MVDLYLDVRLVYRLHLGPLTQRKRNHFWPHQTFFSSTGSHLNQFSSSDSHLTLIESHWIPFGSHSYWNSVFEFPSHFSTVEAKDGISLVAKFNGKEGGATLLSLLWRWHRLKLWFSEKEINDPISKLLKKIVLVLPTSYWLDLFYVDENMILIYTEQLIDSQNVVHFRKKYLTTSFYSCFFGLCGCEIYHFIE